MSHHQANAILEFWFSERVEPFWFAQSAALDQEITQKFGSAYTDARAGKLDAWRDNADQALALTIVLDQFPRNMFRGLPRCYESDGLARNVANHALDQGFDRKVDAKHRQFFYLPLMHSEDLGDQTRCVELYEPLGNANALDFARQHRDIIARFGRFPHRNTILERKNTPEEDGFLVDHKGF